MLGPYDSPVTSDQCVRSWLELPARGTQEGSIPSPGTLIVQHWTRPNGQRAPFRLSPQSNQPLVSIRTFPRCRNPLGISGGHR